MLGRPVNELMPLIYRNLLAIGAFQAGPSFRQFRFIGNPRKRVKERCSGLRVYLTVGEFLVAIGTAKNPSRHFFTLLVLFDWAQRKVSLGLL